MSFRDQVAEEVKESAENRSDNQEEEELDQIEVDFDETPFVKFSPTTMPTFTFPEDEGNPVILLKNGQRLGELGDDGKDDDGRDLRFLSTRYLGLVVDDLSAYTDEDEGFDETAIVETGDNDNTEYRIFDLSDDSTEEKYDGDAIEVDGNTYDVENRVDSIDDRAILVVDRTASTSVARTLDIRGGPTAGMDDSTGQVNGALVEYAPNDEEVPESGRYARPFVELRPDLYGEEVGIMVTRRSEVDDEFAEEVENDPSQNDMMWYSVFDMETGDSLERGDYGEPISYSYLQWNFDASAGNLDEDQWDFVQQYIENDLPDDEDTIRENIAENADTFDNEPNTDRMTSLIQNEVTAE